VATVRNVSGGALGLDGARIIPPTGPGVPDVAGIDVSGGLNALLVAAGLLAIITSEPVPGDPQVVDLHAILDHPSDGQGLFFNEDSGYYENGDGELVEPGRLLPAGSDLSDGVAGQVIDVTGHPISKADLVDGKVPTAQLPAISTNESVAVADQAAMLALTAAQVQPGDVALRSDQAGRRWILIGADPSILANWLQTEIPDGVSSVNGQDGAVVLAAADVGAATPGQVTAAVDAEEAARDDAITDAVDTEETARDAAIAAAFVSPAAAKTLAVHRCLLFAGETGVGGSVTALKSMLIDVVAPPSGAIRLKGRVAYATGSTLGTLVGLGIYTEGLAFPIDVVGFAAKPTIAAGVVNPPEFESVLQGLTPGASYAFVLIGQTAGGGTADYATTFHLEAQEVHL